MNGEVPELRAADIDAFANRLRSKGGSIAIFGAHQFFKKRGYQTGGLYQAIRNLAVLQQHRFSKIGQNIVLIEGAAAGQQSHSQNNSNQPATGDAAHPLWCRFCRVKCGNEHLWRQHQASSAHRIKLALAIAAQSNALTANTGGVHVTVLPQLTCSMGQEVIQRLEVRNTSQAVVTLKCFNTLRRSPFVSVLDARGHAPPGRPLALPPGTSTSLTVSVSVDHYGLVVEEVLLDFEAFTIVRAISVKCEVELPPDVRREDLAPKEPYVHKQKRRLAAPPAHVIRGEAPKRSQHTWAVPPGKHDAPGWLRDAFTVGNTNKLQEILSKPVSSLAQYAHKLSHLLWAEELQHEVEVQQYDMNNQRLDTDRFRRFFRLRVPGLAENRPSVLRGDCLFVTRSDGSTAGTQWEGYVHHVDRDEVSLRFDRNFHSSWIEGMEFNVRFTISRATFNFMQSAIARAPRTLHPALLLGSAGLDPQGAGLLAGAPPPGPPPAPSKGQGRGSGGRGRPPAPSPPPGPPAARPVKRITQDPIWTPEWRPNPEQEQAVRRILTGDHAPLPYLIFGPPGTGKTMTATGAAAQIYKLDRDSRLLLAAPSNSAADLLAERMLKFGVPRSELLRICAFSRPKVELPSDLLAVSNWKDSNEDEGAFELPELGQVMYKRVVVVTCLMAAKLHALGVPAGHFTHVFVDEAGHAEEPLTLAATAGLLTPGNSARLILAGDPQQLGPIVLSPLAQRYGLSMSMMERLIHVEPYKRREGTSQAYDPAYITKLRRNYRSHPAILRLPNALFYANELIEAANPDVTHSLMSFPGLTTGKYPSRDKQGARRFPIIFHSIVGKDERESSSPSWFNVDEAALINKYVMALLDMKNNRPAPKDIGVITPYRKQVQRIRILTRKISDDIKVGSVEEFQGQERRAILISTVRSSHDHLEFDAKHRLGFLANPKRFNVSITRAKALIVIVGNPAILLHDPNWGALLAYVYRNGGWQGSPPPPSVVDAAEKYGPAGSPAEDDWFKSLTSAALSASTAAGGPAAGVLGSGAHAGASVYGLGDGAGPSSSTQGKPSASNGATSQAASQAEALIEQLARLTVGGSTLVNSQQQGQPSTSSGGRGASSSGQGAGGSSQVQAAGPSQQQQRQQPQVVPQTYTSGLLHMVPPPPPLLPMMPAPPVPPTIPSIVSMYPGLIPLPIPVPVPVGGSQNAVFDNDWTVIDVEGAEMPRWE